MLNDYVYKDRKMMKWIPFHALLEQGDHVSDLINGRQRKVMPLLSYDQQEELNFQLQTAYAFNAEIIVTYFNNHDFHTVQGKITRIDMFDKKLYIDDKSVHAQLITNIEMI